MVSPTKSTATTDSLPLSTEALDRLTGGAFSASTSGERAAKIRDWLASQPDLTLIQEVFKEISSKDKGAAKPLRERLDEIKRQRAQESIAQEWAHKAEQLLAQEKLNIADAMAWQRDAAKAGAGLSREPLLTLKQQLVARTAHIEDLQKSCQIQREAAVLLTQRTEVLSTKALSDALAARETLQNDFKNWESQAADITNNAHWRSVDSKFPPLLESSGLQLLAVWNAFSAALDQAQAALADANAALPNVPIWASDIRKAHGLAEPIAPTGKPGKPTIDPEKKAQATTSVSEALGILEAELAQGHGKASLQAASIVRQRLKDYAGILDHKLEHQAQAALNAAGEIEGWQRWRADQIRQELVTKAQGLLNRPSGQALGGKKIQEQLRSLREQWKAADQGGPANHALWKKFDEACNEAHAVVDLWIEKVKADNAVHRQARLDLIKELEQWTAQHANGPDWKEVHRSLYQWAQRWQDAGHVSEKTFAEVQPLWKTAFDAAVAPIEAVQAQSVERRKQMTAEADQLGAATVLNIDQIKALQKRWQTEASHIPLDRKFEQKLWDRFRKPIDEAFARKSSEREKAEQAMGEYDRAVLAAAKALQEVSQSGDVSLIQTSLHHLKQVMSGASLASTAPTTAKVPSSTPVSAPPTDPSTADTPHTPPTAQVAQPPKPIVAMRGDDRPGAKRPEAVASVGARGHNAGVTGANKRSADARPLARTTNRGDSRDTAVSRLPRLGDAAFRAQRNAIDAAEFAMKHLAIQAHGEVVTKIMTAWQTRDAANLPTAQALGNKVSASVRQAWAKALTSSNQDNARAATALLRLEVATDTPTPAAFLEARRSLQLQLLTRRNDPAPKDTWATDVAQVLESLDANESVQRLQTVLKVLLQGR